MRLKSSILAWASDGVRDFSQGIEQKMLLQLVGEKSSDVRPFIDGIDEINRISNQPMLLLADDEAVYLLPAEDEA